jgi:prophage regulatory protein
MAKRNGTPHTQAPDSETIPKMLTVKHLRDNLTLSRTAIYRGVRAGTFPAPVQLTPTRIAWRESDVLAWLNSRPAA